MKSIILSSIICNLLVSNINALGQIFATNRSGEIFTNSIGQAQAIKIASHLRLDMSEGDAKAYLRQNGLGLVGSVGDSFGWSDFYTLTNRATLGLDIKPKIF